MNDELYVMRDEKVSKAIWILTVPAIVSSMVTMLYNIIDTHFISLLNNPATIAATTVGLPLTMIIQSFGEGIAIGSGSLISKFMGQNKIQKAHTALHTSVTLTLVIGFSISGIFLVFLKDILPMFNIASDVNEFSYDYMFIILCGGIAIISKQVLVYLLRSQGIVKWPMISIFAGIILNIILDPLFMFENGLNLNIRGAALATTVSELFTMLMMLFRLLKADNPLPFKISSLHFDQGSAARILSIGSSAFVRNMLPSFSLLFLIRAAGAYSTDLVAAMGISKKSLRIITCIFSGYSHGLQPFESYNYGANQTQRVKEALSISHKFVILAGLSASAVFFFRGKYVAALFVDNPGIVFYCIKMLKGYALSLPVLGIYHVYAATFQAIGESKKSFILSIARQGLFYIPIVLLLPSLLNEMGIYLAQPVSDWMTFVLLLIIY